MAFVSTPSSVSAVMLKVLFALVPAIAVYQLYFGPAILISLVLASVTAIVSITLAGQSAQQARFTPLMKAATNKPAKQ